jgi:hypothetical protein
VGVEKLRRIGIEHDWTGAPWPLVEVEVEVVQLLGRFYFFP